jgi:asparagine synthase (glutamine-hydrolysing)
MASGLEIRVPFLDKALIDYVFSLPGEARVGESREPKRLLRLACADLLRPEILRKNKQGFVFPVAKWMLGLWREFAEDALESLKGSGIVDDRGVREVWNEFLREPQSALWSRAWTLVVFGTYLKSLAETSSASQGRP